MTMIVVRGAAVIAIAAGMTMVLAGGGGVGIAITTGVMTGAMGMVGVTMIDAVAIGTGDN